MKSHFSERPRASLLTLGCRVNQYETDVIAGELEAAGFDIVPLGEASDITIVNTCTVTAESDRKSRQYIRRAAAAHPETPVIVTGCFAQISPEAAAQLPGVSVVVGNADKAEIPALARRLIAENTCAAVQVSDIMRAPYDGMTLSKPRRARAYIKIEDGCNNRCAYCIIPRARGSVRSKSPDVVIAEAAVLSQNGCSEIILTGIETAAYGRDSDGSITLASLLERLDSIPGIRRIGLGSLDPSLMHDDFLATASSLASVLPHFHLSLQSGSSSVLRRMRRPYNAEQAMERIAALRRVFPEVMLTADVIVGFPGETESEFEETVRFCESVQFLHLHIFPYSIRRGTEAASMDGQIPEEEKRLRASVLAKKQTKIKSALLQDYVCAHKQSPVYVLVEEESADCCIGHSEHYVEVHFQMRDARPGDIVPVRLRETDGSVCLGMPHYCSE